MWNLKPSNPVCYKKKITIDHLRHINNLDDAKPRITNDIPWQPTCSLSKYENKYFHQNEAKISYENNILLNRMMEIQLKNKLYKTKNYLSQLYPDGQGSLVENFRRGVKRKINIENQAILKRLQSASSLYQKKWWVSKNSLDQKYRTNLLRKTKVNDDYGLLARKMLLKSASQKSLRNKRAQTANPTIQQRTAGDQIYFQDDMYQ